ncbi:protein LURP-one-related 8-like [Triticum dicoccoides]|uniref:protein LURP-one-related 8-like n=1 Tax=Triticum dicoccoides TaxID=85692 RepID=UPI000E78D703|nr:protein LURP-one-related 8-like [Triticum dicoccoides]
MAKVHPNVAAPELLAGGRAVVEEQQPTVLTVWRKSLLFNCDGFTVFDSAGGLAFRVDRYGFSSGIRRRAEDVVLMDAAGKPLLTVRRKIKLSLGLGEHWVVYDGEATASTAKPLLSVRRHHAGLRRRASDKTLAHVTPLGPSSAGADAAAYVVEGSYGRRSCAVRDVRGGASVAEVQRKESVGDDVFRLVVPDHRLGTALSMGVVIALDQMFGAASSRTSLLNRSWSA